jgi:hypothetical protein
MPKPFSNRSTIQVSPTNQRLHLPRRSRHVPASDWRPIDRDVPEAWHRLAKAKGFRIAGRVRDRLHLALECRACGAVTAHKTFTLRSAQPRCGGCAEAALRAQAVAAGVTFLRPAKRNRHYALYQMPDCGHVVRRQHALIRRVAAGETDLRCERCLIQREAAVAAKQGWQRLSRDPGGNPSYRMYQHDCGHNQRIAVANMHWGQVQCSRCGRGWSSQASFIYLLRIAVPEAGLHVLKLGYSKHPVKRFRHQLGLPSSAQVELLRVLPMPTGHAACAAETRAHARLCQERPDMVVPQADYATVTNLRSEIYRPGALATLMGLMDEIEAQKTNPS